MTVETQPPEPRRVRPRRAVSASIALAVVGLLVAASALAWAPKQTPQDATHSEADSAFDPTPAATADHAGHNHPSPRHDSIGGRDEEDHDGGHPSASRPAHIRLRDQRDALLFSTWPGEEGALQHIDPTNGPVGIVNWTGPEGIVGTRPLWEPVVPMFSLAPPNSTVELRNYTIPPTTLGEVRIPKMISVPLSGELSREEADKAFGKNLTSGDAVFFLGQIPIRITSVTNQTVGYTFDLPEPRTFNVTRSIGLQATATSIPSEGVVRFAFSAPGGSFTAHNNCALPSKYLEPGYYVVRDETDEELLLTRYNNQVEHIIQGTTIHLQVTFLDTPTTP